MRLPAVLAAVLVAAAGLAGCFGAEDEPATPAGTDGNNNILPGTGSGSGTITILGALKTSIATESPSWVQSGTAVDVSAADVTGPASMKAPFTYTWAVGPLPGTVAIEAKADTKEIKAGESASIKYSEAGVYRMHCHPHPFMLHNVTVVDGYESPSTVHVSIVDGKKTNEYLFVPEELVVGVGTTVVYHNNGTQMHTATASAQEPPLKAASLTEATGQVTVEGDGWQRIVLVVQDKDGRTGITEHHVYVTETLPEYKSEPMTFEFNVGGAPSQVEAAKTASLLLEHGGKLFMNWTAKDGAASAGAPENLAEIELHLVEQGATQDTLTGDSSASGAASTTASAGSYTLSVLATQGAKVTATVTIEVVYDLVPPAPAMPAADDGHGDHGGHGGH